MFQMDNTKKKTQGGGKGGGKQRVTRSITTMFDFNDEFPILTSFTPPDKLPDYQSMVGVLRNLLEGEGKGKTTVNMASREVGKMIIAKWFHDNVYHKSVNQIQRMIMKVYNVYMEGKQRQMQQRFDSEGYKKFVDLYENRKKLFDVYPEDPQRIQKCQEEWGGMRMTDRDMAYYEDMKGPRLMVCTNRCDPLFYMTWLKQQRQEEARQTWMKDKQMLFKFRSLKEVKALLIDRGEEFTDSEDEGHVQVQGEVDLSLVRQENVGPAKKKKKVFKKIDDNGDTLPISVRHIRVKERQVRPEFYQTCAALTGLGLSIPEASAAIVVVGNKMFGRSWKNAADDENTFDCDTVPTARNIRMALQLQEVEGMARTVELVQDGKAEGRAVTHASDSTTKKGAGQFIVQALHVGQTTQIDLPILPIYGETAEDIAIQADMGLEILAASKGITAKEVYSLVDVHMADSTAHNKEIASCLAELYDLDTPAGQIFCNTHTTLGFAAGMNKVLRLVEAGMHLEEVVKTFMVDLDFDTKNSSVAGQALDMILRLVAPEYSHKPWNRNKQYKVYLQERDLDGHLFAYKDARFGCLSKAAAVALYNFDNISNFLEDFPDINNRLACLVREVMVLPYIKPVFVVWAAIGIHLVEPFYARTIQEGATHSSLKKFFKVLYQSMARPITSTFFLLQEPLLDGVGSNMFEAVKKNYGLEVVDSVVQIAKEYMEEAKMVANLSMVELRIVLARQRRDYGIDEEMFPADFPVLEQAVNIDDTPVTNVGMERSCGKVDYRLQKLKHLDAVSRSIILQKTQVMRDNNPSNFRSFKGELERVKELKIFWSERMKAAQEKGSDEKQEVAKLKEDKRLDNLEFLKSKGGPFTDEREVEEYLAKDEQEKDKVKRMKMELQFARDSSTLLPKVDPIFRVQITVPETGKRRQKTPGEFGAALKVLLGKRSSKAVMEYSSFQTILAQMVDGQRERREGQN